MASSVSLPPADPITNHDDKARNQAFEDAYKRFFESLSPKERLLYSPCASQDDFINALHKLEEVANKCRKRDSSRVLDCIGKIAERFQPFFGVVNIMIQSNPEYTALAWGALLFILQLASSFSTFFEKLIATLERFCNEIPRYEEIHSMVSHEGQISVRIKECTEKVYGHMFQFFMEVANVFTSDGRIKRTPVVIAELLWRPFESRFDGLLKQIRSCRSLIEFDFLIFKARIARNVKDIVSAQKLATEKELEERKNAEKKADELAAMTDEIARRVSQSHRGPEQLFERIQKWLSPPQYSDALFHGKHLREPGTNKWIFSNPRFCEWREREWTIKPSGQRRKTGPNILWIKGNPGTGKSVLASSVIHELKSANSQGDQRREVCYCFFTPDCKNSTTRTSAYRSILAQILHAYRQDDELINKFDFIMTGLFSSGTPQAGMHELFELVKLLFQQLQIFLVLDGIDECEDNPSLIEDIMELSECSSAKVLLYGRTNTESLIRAVTANAQICLDRGIVNTDMRLFISTQVGLLLDDGLLPPGSNSKDLVNRLCNGADGMFLWAKLMFNYLGLPVHDPYSRLEVIRSVVLPEGLENMYARIVDVVSRAGKTSRNFARIILAWASYSMQPLTLEELYDQMKFKISNTSKVDSTQLEAFRESVCIVCGGLIEFLKPPSQYAAHAVLRYVHLSVKEYFSQVRLGSEIPNPLVSPEASEHLTCATICLEYLLHHVPARQGRLGHADPTDPPLGKFSGYAARNWVVHLDWSSTSAFFNGSDISSALMGLAPNLSDFLRDSTKVKFWIYILYSHPNPCTPDGISSYLDELAFTLSGSHSLPASMENLLRTMQKFCQDVSKLLNAWDKHLRRSTDILWDEMAIFSDSPFMTGPGKGRVISMAPGPPPGIIDPKSSLVRKMSRTGLDGDTTAVVSLWRNLRSPTDSIVKYELWKNIPLPTRLSEIIVPIEHQPTIHMHPLSISDDLMSFAILDRLFVLVPNGNEAPVSTRSAKIPIRYSTSKFGTCTSLFKLSPHGRFLLSSDSSLGLFADSRKRQCAKATMFEIENEGLLQVKPILYMSFEYWNYPDALEALFHPSHPIVIMGGGTWIAAWNFAKEDRSKPKSSFKMLHRVTNERHVKNLNLVISSCGKFVDSAHGFLPIPEWFFTPGRPDFNELATSQRSDPEGDQPTQSSLVSHRQGSSALQLSPGRPLQPTQILTLAHGTPVQRISVQGGEEIRITSTDLQSNRTDQVMNIIRLPQGQGMNRVTPTILVPTSGDESIRMILNDEGRDGQRPNELPIFISRDIDAIKHILYDDVGQHVDVLGGATLQRVRDREESGSSQVAKRRRTMTM